MCALTIFHSSSSSWVNRGTSTSFLGVPCRHRGALGPRLVLCWRSEQLQRRHLFWLGSFNSSLFSSPTVFLQWTVALKEKLINSQMSLIQHIPFEHLLSASLRICPHLDFSVCKHLHTYKLMVRLSHHFEERFINLGFFSLSVAQCLLWI